MCYRRKKTGNDAISKLFTSVKGNCKSLGHTNECAQDARHKSFALWHYFGPPLLFVTISPCDECSYHVQLFANMNPVEMPTLETFNSPEACLADLKMRKHIRATYPGACSLEYQNIIDIVKTVLIGWDDKKKIGSKGIFGIPLAFVDSAEEQGRKSLHSAILLEVKCLARTIIFVNK